MYASFLIEAVFNFPLDPASSYLSEYFARDSPYRLVFATADLLSAALVLSGIICLAEVFPLWNKVQILIAIGYSVFAIATVFDVTLPLKCAESLNYCEQTGLTAHMVASAIANIALCAVALLTLLMAYRGRFLQPNTSVIAGVSVLYIVFTVVVTICNFGGYPVGYPQRIQVFFSCAILMFAGSVLRPYGITDSRISTRT